MPFPTATLPAGFTVATIASNQAVKVTITVTNLSTLADKIVALSVHFTSIANNEFGYFAKFVPAADTSVDFVITVPFPDNANPAAIPITDIIQSTSASYYFVDGNPAPLNG